MRPRHAALALLASVLLSPALAGPAAAGGPTSVLLVAPAEGRTASLYAGQADYEELSGLVDDSGSSSDAAAGEEHAIGTEVTVTWLIHDVSVWRVDRIYLDAPGGPWIASQMSFDGNGDIWSSPVRWHTVTQGKPLMILLTRLGLLDDTAAAPPADVAPPASPAAVQPTTTPISRAATGPAAADGASGPIWGLVGLALGVALTVAALRVAGRRRQDEPEVATSQPMDDVLASTGATLRR
ncbi:MAG: hypothetical protein QOD68_3344 [Actinomycetota bacterium]|jgi:hypothetical protein|nr:hypothetical protein [Actinomycetota bacterium]